MKLLVFGTSEFAVPTLEALAVRHDVVGVVTQPDRPAGRGQKLVATPVKRAAQARGLRVYMPEKLKPFVDEARALGAEAFVVASYGKIVPQALLDLVRRAFNVHPSLLPLYRGATPIQTAIRDGRAETGVTIIAMDAGMDTGDVLLHVSRKIEPNETYGELHDRLAQDGAQLVLEAIDLSIRGALNPRTQDDVAIERQVSRAEIEQTLTRPLDKNDLVLPKVVTARRLLDFIRSRAPEPSARLKDLSSLLFPDGNIGVGSARITRAHPLWFSAGAFPFENSVPPGRLVVVSGYWFIRATDGWVAVDELIVEGGKKMPMSAYANGHKVTSDLPPSVLDPLREEAR